MRLVATGATPPNPAPPKRSRTARTGSDGANAAAPSARPLSVTVAANASRRPSESATYPIRRPPVSWPAPEAVTSNPACPGVRPHAALSPTRAKLMIPRFRPLLPKAKLASRVTRPWRVRAARIRAAVLRTRRSP